MTTPTRRVTPTARRLLPFDAPREKWLEARRHGVGSSDVAAIVGVSPYTTARHVYFDKIGELPERDAGEAAMWGNLLEDVVAREWARRNKTSLARVGVVANIATPWAMCTLDRQVGRCPDLQALEIDNNRCALEVKTRSAWVAGNWRGGVPDDVHAQAVWQMMVTGYDHIHVAALIGGQDFRQYTIKHDEALELGVFGLVSEFWHGCVENRNPPPVTDPADLDVELTRWGQFDGSIEVAEVPAYRAYLDYQESALAEAGAKRKKELAKAELVALLEGHAIGVIAGERLYSYLPASRPAKVDLEKLEADYPAAYAECVTPGVPSPTLRLNTKYKIEEHR